MPELVHDFKFIRGVAEMKNKMWLQASRAPLWTVAFAAFLWPLGALGQAIQDIRVVTFNTQGDESINNSVLLPNLATVLEGIGQEKYVGDNILQLPDIIALQETTSNSTTVVPLAGDLNSYYGASIFGSSTYQATQHGSPTIGNGPNALIYNQQTLNLIASVGVGTPGGGSNGEFRQVVRYEFQPISDTGTGNGVFYVYDSHYKSGSAGTSDDGSTDGALRNGEAQIIRNDEASALPANAAVLYVGDYNGDGSSEAAYQTITAPNSPGGINQGQALDPLNLTLNYSENWSTNSAYQGIMSESVNNLRYRDDLQLMTSNVLNDSPGTLNYITNSYHAFGNNGGTAVHGNINSGSNTAINDIIGNGSLTPSQVFAAMNNTTGSDHLPVVADYSIAIGPFTLTWDNAGGSGDGVTWDTSSQNWNNAGSASKYTDGSNVVFNDSNNGHYAVTLNTTVQPLSVVINTSGAYTISGVGGIAGTGSLTKSGSGSATLSTVNSYTGGTNVTNGTLVVGANGALPANQAVTLTGGTMQLAPNTGGETVSSLSITGGSTLDLTNNHIVIDYGNPANQATVDSTVEGYIISGAIFSSLSNGSYGVGWADGNDASEAGIVAPDSVLIAYTLYGDADLDGAVTGNDFTILASNLGKVVSGWDKGDFDYDGTVTGNDFTALVSNLGKSASGADVKLPAADYVAIDAFAAANGLMSDVPEPGVTMLLLPVGVLFLSRQRRFNPRRVHRS
jgi:autotransporter-associated beta strand protein